MEQIESQIQKAISLCRSDDYKSAVPILESVFKEKDDTESGYYLALAYAQLQDYDSALSIFDSILKRLVDPPRIMQAHILLGYIYTTREMYDLAEFELIEAVSIGFDNPQAHSALGFVYFKRKDYKNALEHLSRALELNSNNSNARNTLGFILAENGNSEEAIKQIRKALESDENNPAYLDSLGWAYFLKKDYFNARRFLTRAFEVAPDSKDIKEHLLKLEEESPRKKSFTAGDV